MKKFCSHICFIATVDPDNPSMFDLVCPCSRHMSLPPQFNVNVNLNMTLQPVKMIGLMIQKEIIL